MMFSILESILEAKAVKAGTKAEQFRAPKVCITLLAAPELCNLALYN
jgi:hypothetical protein